MTVEGRMGKIEFDMDVEGKMQRIEVARCG